MIIKDNWTSGSSFSRLSLSEIMMFTEHDAANDMIISLGYYTTCMQLESSYDTTDQLNPQISVTGNLFSIS